MLLLSLLNLLNLLRLRRGLLRLLGSRWPSTEWRNLRQCHRANSRRWSRLDCRLRLDEALLRALRDQLLPPWRRVLALVLALVYGLLWALGDSRSQVHAAHVALQLLGQDTVIVG